VNTDIFYNVQVMPGEVEWLVPETNVGAYEGFPKWGNKFNFTVEQQKAFVGSVQTVRRDALFHSLLFHFPSSISIYTEIGHCGVRQLVTARR
jgi:hypothetical protein